MIILVDIGNSSIKVATSDGNNILSIARLTSRRDLSSDEIFILLNTLGIKQARDAVVCSVVPELTSKFTAMFKFHYNIGHPVVVTPYIHSGLELNYKTLSNLGADRIANSVGAYFGYGKDMAVVDFGTATTIDFVTAQGKFLGGIITPGLESSLRNLVSSTSRLFEVEPVKPSYYLGQSTEECLQSGFYLLTVGLIEAVRAAVRKETGIDFTFVATGGLAERFAPFSSSIEMVDRNLTLKGCMHLYKLNKGDGHIDGTEII